MSSSNLHALFFTADHDKARGFTSTGSGQESALLFEMNALFEEYISRLVSRALASSELRVPLQGGRLLCLT